MPSDRGVLVGRGEELELIRVARERGRAGVVLSGATGVGKTRLADEAAALPKPCVAPGPIAHWTATFSLPTVPTPGQYRLVYADTIEI